MSPHLFITVRWIGDRFHGFIDGTEVLEWPPSPFRLFQALVAGAHRYGLDATMSNALAWIERQPIAPDVLASPRPSIGTIFDHWVPDNDDLQEHRRGSIRKFCPTLLEAHPLVHYVWRIDPSDEPPLAALDELTSTLSSLGWAIDQAYAVATLASSQQIDAATLGAARLSRFRPIRKTTSPIGSLRVPKRGSIRDLNRIHSANCTALRNQAERRRKRWPREFDRVLYTGIAQPIGRPFVIFKLVKHDGNGARYSHHKLIHLAGMVRHLAIEKMEFDPPADVDEQWVRRYVAGHQDAEDKRAGKPHAQFSYLPLPSIRHISKVPTDPAVRLVMVSAPVGDDAKLSHLARRLDGLPLQALPNTQLDGAVRLERINGVNSAEDKVSYLYTEPARAWASVTPIILPGHDDHKPTKTRRLIEKALAQSGVELPCEFEWSAFSRFQKSLSAHKYDRQGRLTGYIRPNYLLDRTAVHLTLRFEKPIPGPLVIGAGRHCGLGLMAAID